jgi:hypothetical protein
MSTGHAPDDWLDIPPPPFGPAGDDDPEAPTNGNGDAPAVAAEMPTGEIQVVDVPAAEDAGPRDADVIGAAAAEAQAAEAQAAEAQAAEAQAAEVGEMPTGEIQVVDVPDAEPAGSGDADGTVGTSVTMTGQFRSLAAALAAELGSEPASPPDPPDRPAASDATAGTGDAPAVAAPAAEPADPAEAATGELPSIDPANHGPGDGPTPVSVEGPGAVTMTGQFRSLAAALAAQLADEPADTDDPSHRTGADVGGDADGPSARMATDVGGEADGPGADGTGGGGGTGGDAAGGGGTGDVGGLEAGGVTAAPAPKAWRVPVLRAKRDPEQPIPADAVPAATVAEPAVAAGAVGAERAGVGEPVEAVGAGGAGVVGDEVRDEGEVRGEGEIEGEGEVGGEVEGGAAASPAMGGGGALGPRARRRIEADRHRRVRLRRQRRRVVVGLAVLVTTGATLGIVGMGRVRGSTGGRYVDPQVRPDEPGYVALVTPTPTLLVVNKDADGGLSGVSLLSLHAQDQGGSVIVMPVSTVAPFAEAGTTFADAYAESGARGVANQIQLTLNIVIGETVEVDDARWATLVEPVAPIEVELDQAVGEWPAGAAEIEADDVGAFLTARTDSETELGRLDRQELFWESWLPQVKAGGRNAVPGEVDVGLGRFVRGLAAGDFDVNGLPVSAAFSSEEMYGPSEEMLPDLVAHAVPYPQEPSRGSRVQVQLLNGTTRRDLTARAATSLVAGSAEIALVGNAGSFAEATTRFVYTDSKLRDDAEKLRDAFGVGEVVQQPADDDAPPVDDDRIDVTVILGADALDALGG